MFVIVKVGGGGTMTQRYGLAADHRMNSSLIPHRKRLFIRKYVSWRTAKSVRQKKRAKRWKKNQKRNHFDVDSLPSLPWSSSPPLSSSESSSSSNKSASMGTSSTRTAFSAAPHEDGPSPWGAVDGLLAPTVLQSRCVMPSKKFRN